MSQHTPGPWVHMGRMGNGHDTKWLIKHKSRYIDGGVFCEVVPLHVTAEAMATGEANARLITAAPDLLAALQRLVAVANDTDFDNDWVEAWLQADAAIARATRQGGAA